MKKVLGTILTVAFLGTILALFIKTSIKNSPETPKTLSEIIIENMKEHSSDWTFINKEDTISHKNNMFAMDDEFFTIEFWENKNCNIKIKQLTSAIGTSLTLISPDSLDFNHEEDTDITLAKYDYFDKPDYSKIEAAKQKSEDSIANLRIKQEKLIISKLCK